ncbi:MAG: flagellar motor switch protein FliM [Planctomycetota bacterium]
MAEVLNQNDIDALLSAVDDPTEGAAEAQDEGLIFSRRRGGRISPLEVEVREYDFKRPERVSKDQMRALEGLHETFSRSYGAALSGFLRTIVEVKVAHIEQMTFSEFTHSLPNPTCFNLISCSPLEGHMCLEISPLIVYPVMDRLLGGSNADLFIPQRPLTAIEMRLVGKIIQRAMDALSEAWSGILQLGFQLDETESNPALVQIVPPNEVVVVVSFEIKMGGRAGTMSLCVPYNVIEPVVDRLSNQTWAAYKRAKKDARLREQLTNQLESARVGISAVLADTRITLEDLRGLQIGDVLLTEKPASAPLTLEVEGKRKFIGKIAQYRGNRAFQVQRPLKPKDRV